ncbi:MAG: metallophosphoesterase, partial [Firmicutes bacterium]|nr:metallophosphoesterase [Bacillota bacterium]
MKKKKVILIIALLLVLIAGAGIFLISRADYEQLSGWEREIYSAINRQKIIDSRFIGKVSDENWTPETVYRLEDTIVLQKEEGRDFRVMVIGDLHMSDYSETYMNAVLANRNFYYIKRMARELKPDLIVLSGDIFCEDGNSNYHSIHRLTSYMDSLEIPWAAVLGDHEDLANCDRNYVADVMMSGKYCVMKKGDPEMGVGNYVVNVCDKDGTLLHSLILMDTHHWSTEGGNLWENQLEWYRWAVEGALQEARKLVESTVITHIPCAQYDYAYNEAWDTEKNTWKDGYEAFGYNGEDPCIERDASGAPVDNGFFALIKELGSTKNL